MSIRRKKTKQKSRIAEKQELIQTKKLSKCNKECYLKITILMFFTRESIGFGYHIAPKSRALTY